MAEFLTVVEKLQPIYKLSNGKLYLRVTQREAIDDPLSVRAKDKLKTLWFLPLSDVYGPLDGGVNGDEEKAG